MLITHTFRGRTLIYMTVRNSYQIVKVFNSLCVSVPLRVQFHAKAQSRKEKKRKEWIKLKNSGKLIYAMNWS